MPTLDEIIREVASRAAAGGPPKQPVQQPAEEESLRLEEKAVPKPKPPFSIRDILSDPLKLGIDIASGQLSLSPSSPKLPDVEETSKKVGQEVINILTTPSQSKSESPGLRALLPELIKHPIDTAILGPGETALAALKGVGGTLLNIPNALSYGVKFPGSLDPALPIPQTLSEVPANFLHRLGRILNAATLGMPDFILHNAAQLYPPGAANPYTGQKGTELPLEKQLLFLPAGALKGFVWDPIQQLLAVAKGETVEGEPLTPRTFGREASAAAVALLPLLGFAQAKGLRQIPREVARRSVPTRSFRTEGEILEAARQLSVARSAAAQKGVITKTLKQIDELYKSEAEKPPTLKPPTLTDLEAHFRAVEEGLFNNPTFELVVNDAIRSKVWDSLAPQLYAAGHPATKVVADVIRRGGISDETISLLRDQFGLPPVATAEAIKNAVANVVEATSSHRGKGLSVTSNLLRQRLDETLLAVYRDRDPEAIKALRRLRLTLRRASSDPSASVISKAETLAKNMDESAVFRALRKIETVGLASMLSQPKTAIRNVRTQGLIFLTQIIGDVASGFVESVAGIARGDGFNFYRYFTDLDSSFIAALNGIKRAVGLKTGNVAAIDEILRSIPELGDEMLNASQHQAFGSALADVYTAFLGARKRGASLGEALGSAKEVAGLYSKADLYRDVLMVMMRTQEVWFRKLFFDSRLRSNLKAIGFRGNYTDLVKVLRENPEISPQLRLAIDNAFVHAMRSTFASNPESNFGRAYLRAMNSVPLIPKIGLVTFPRYLANSLRFLSERNPGQFFELFNPEVRKILLDYTNGDRLPSRIAARRIGKAAEGAFLFGAALAIRNDPNVAGPKYWQLIDRVDPDGTIYYEDYRTQQPFVQFLGLADLAKAYANGKTIKDLPYTPNELVDLAIGLPRLSNQFFFNIPLIPQLLARGKSEDLAEAVLGPIGQFFGAFTMPVQVWQDLYAEATQERSYSYDIRGEELTGPLRAHLGAFLPERLSLPPRIDPTTGENVVYETPVKDQLTGIITRKATKFSQWMDSTPGVGVQDLVGRPGSPEAERMVAMITGSILTLKPDKDSPSLGNTLTSIFNDPKRFSPEMRNEILRIIVGAIRDAATETAFSLRPDLFPEKMAQMQSVPQPFRPTVDELIKTIIGRLRAEGVFKQPRSIP